MNSVSRKRASLEPRQKLRVRLWPCKKVQVGKDQEKAQSEKDSTPKTEVGKNQTNNQVLIP